MIVYEEGYHVYEHDMNEMFICGLVDKRNARRHGAFFSLSLRLPAEISVTIKSNFHNHKNTRPHCP